MAAHIDRLCLSILRTSDDLSMDSLWPQVTQSYV